MSIDEQYHVYRAVRCLCAGIAGLTYEQFLAGEWAELRTWHKARDGSDSLVSGGEAPQEEASMSWRPTRSDGFSYDQVGMEVLHALVISATSSGCGISFGTTKDRAAVVITIFAGDSGKEVTYARSASDVSVLLSDLQMPEFMAWAKEHQPV